MYSMWLSKYPIFIFSVLLLSSQASAQTPPVLRTTLSDNGQTLSLSLTTNEPNESCTAKIYAAARPSQLRSPSNKRLISEIDNRAEGVSYVATFLKKIRRGARGARRKRISLRAGITCDGVEELSSIERIRIKTGKRAPRTNRWLSQLSEAISPISFKTEEAFPNLTFSFPVDLKPLGDGSERLAVASQRGTITVFENDSETSTSSTFLDLSDTIQNGRELGLLSVAFHPDYETNGYFYVYYSELGTSDSIIARYSVSESDASVADPDSELILLRVAQPSSIHQGGMMAFGPADGYLYISLGDGGGANDPNKNGQNRGTLLGSLLRIDVDNSTGERNYAIPPDNPFVGVNGAREEIFAYGLRNMWKFSFDSETGEILGADVGQNRFEEVNVITSGANYGWRTVEGNRCHRPRKRCRKRGLTKPIFLYTQDVGSSITGGYIYRGSALPLLSGRYIFGDFVEGKIWSMDRTSGSPVVAQLLDTDLLISSFGIDQNNELYLLSYGEGKVYRLAELSP